MLMKDEQSEPFSNPSIQLVLSFTPFTSSSCLILNESWRKPQLASPAESINQKTAHHSCKILFDAYSHSILKSKKSHIKFSQDIQSNRLRTPYSILLKFIKQYLLMRINLKIVCHLACLVLTTVTLHLQRHLEEYDSQRYQSSLQRKQAKLKQDLQSIQNKFKQLDTSLKQSANDPDQQLRVLNEGLADERDSLYDLQQYLNLPFNERSCRCFNFTQAMKEKLRQQLAKVRESITEIESQTQECSGCEMVIEIKREIKQQKAYLQTMQDTIDAKCCIKYEYVYNDNLQSPNWQYGNMTAVEYQESLGNRTTEGKKIKTCPLSAPFTTKDYSSCQACASVDQNFNLATRKCEECPQGKKFSYEKRKCVFKNNCQANTLLNQETGQCEKIMPALNYSSCPKDRPIWNPVVYACFKCRVETPYYNQETQNCQECPKSFEYNTQAAVCVHKNCNVGQRFDIVTQRCVGKVSGGKGTHSSCPKDHPFWDPESLSCAQCPKDMPQFNIQNKKCEACASNETYSSNYHRCIPSCSSDQVLNRNTWKCEKSEKSEKQPVVPDRADSSSCPPDRPIWNSLSKSCSLCPESEPHWDSAASKCLKCPVNSTWQELTKSCKSMTVTCPDGQTFYPDIGKCKQVSKVDSEGICPPDRPIYNRDDLSCSQCAASEPYFNITSGECQEKPDETVQPVLPEKPKQNDTVGLCSPNSVYDPNLKACIPNEKPVTPETSVEPSEPIKPPTTNYAGYCPPETPVWNPTLLTCTRCPSGEAWNQMTKQCEKCKTDTCEEKKEITCAVNQQYNNVTDKCQPCQTWQLYNNETATCDKVCEQGQVYDSPTGQCHGTISYCNPGTFFDRQQMRCRCKEGDNYNYEQDANYCVKKCKESQYYEVLDKKCIDK